MMKLSTRLPCALIWAQSGTGGSLFDGGPSQWRFEHCAGGEVSHSGGWPLHGPLSHDNHLRSGVYAAPWRRLAPKPSKVSDCLWRRNDGSSGTPRGRRPIGRQRTRRICRSPWFGFFKFYMNSAELRSPAALRWVRQSRTVKLIHAGQQARWRSHPHREPVLAVPSEIRKNRRRKGIRVGAQGGGG